MFHDRMKTQKYKACDTSKSQALNFAKVMTLIELT